MNHNPEISIVIPVKNGVPWLDQCLQRLMAQSLFHKSEIIVIDSGSTDGTIELLQKYPVWVHSVDAGEFNHGLTRNMGVQLSKGKYVVMTVQDAWPTDDLWLQKLIDGFAFASNVAGVCGQQVVPHERDKNPVDWFRPQSRPAMKKYYFGSKENFDALTPAQKKEACGWDDVTAVYRRDVLIQIPFQKIAYGEDAVWAKEALRAGYSIVYNPAATVYHYHNEDFNFSFKRALTVMHLRYRQFGFLYGKPTQSFIDVLRTIKTIINSEPSTTKEKWNWFWYNQQQHRASKVAYKLFFSTLAKGDKALDDMHEEICGKPPVPLQNKKSVERLTVKTALPKQTV